jgi:multicomponent Na+:H+ antiporter subunit D
MLVAMGLAAVACIVIGVVPELLYDRLPFPVDYHPYDLRHITSTLGLLSFTALGFFLLLRHLDPEPKISLDTDWFYRKGSAVVLPRIVGPLVRLESGIVGQIYESLMQWPVWGAAKLLREFDSRVVDATFVGVGRLTQAASQSLRTTASGNAQHYGLIMAVGALALVVLALVTTAR